MSLPKYVFCPRCHKRINVPKIAGQITVASGFVTLECVDKNCSGKVKVKTDGSKVLGGTIGGREL
jgi:hypothetical protein